MVMVGYLTDNSTRTCTVPNISLVAVTILNCDGKGNQAKIKIHFILLRASDGKMQNIYWELQIFNHVNNM